MSKQNNPDIILISNVDSTFVRHDEQLLSEMGRVRKLICQQPKGFFGFIKEQLRIFRFMNSEARKARAVFCWFADYHSFFSALVAKSSGIPFYLIQGGYDTTIIPDLNYGVYTNFLRTAMVNYAYRRASLNLPVSDFLAEEITEKYGSNAAIEVLPTGYDLPVLTSGQVKEPIVLTVAAADTKKRLLIKGIDRFLELAENMTDVKFFLVGLKRANLTDFTIPSNVEVKEFLEADKLGLIYQKAKVYAQFSVREGLPNAVLEAMSYESVVVGMKHSGITEAVGECGYLLQEWNVQEAAEKTRKALADTSLGERARLRVQENFNTEKRRKRLHQLLNATVNN